MTEALLLEPELQTAPEITSLVIVDRMIEILATPEHWCKGRTAEDINNFSVAVDSRGAVRFCLGGALQKVTGESGLSYFDPPVDAVNAAMSDVSRRRRLDRVPFMDADYVRFNDAPDTTHADVLSLLLEVRELVR